MSLCAMPINGDNNCVLEAGHIVPCTADVDGAWVALPQTPYDEIAPGLYMGGSYGGGWQIYMTPVELSTFDAVLTLYSSAPPAEGSVEEHRWHIADSHTLPASEELDAAVTWVYDHWTAGRRVLVRCQAGLNRSGLVTALVLVRAGLGAGEAVDLIRAKRSPYALCNTTFVAHVLGT